MPRRYTLAELEARHALASRDRAAQEIRSNARRLARATRVPIPPWAAPSIGGGPSPAELAREGRLRREETRALMPLLPIEIQAWVGRAGGAVSIQPGGVALYDGRGVRRNFPTLTAAVAAVA